MSRERQPRHLVADPPPTLGELAAEANHEHELCEASSQTALAHALRAGEVLLRARAQVEPGGWLQWLLENFRGTQKTASNYMRIVTYRDEIEPGMSLHACLDMLRGRADATPRNDSPYAEDVRTAAVAAVKAGQTLDEVAARVGVSAPTVWGWKNPGKRREQDVRAKARRRAATEALRKIEREKEIKRAVRKAGAALSEAYSMAERMSAVLSQAFDECADPESRAALLEALRYHHKTRDEIVRALGVSL